jgi:PncC family amidohydrolase
MQSFAGAVMTGKVISLLKERRATLAVAESCTGGRLASAFTAQAGASEFLQGGVVAYSGTVKMRVLGVSPDDRALYGAVSRQVAEQMALGARRVFRTDYTIATTGIAGPDGGSPEKPVGTVWIAVATPAGNVTSRLFHFDGTREDVMNSAVKAAIALLTENIIG